MKVEKKVAFIKDKNPEARLLWQLTKLAYGLCCRVTTQLTGEAFSYSLYVTKLQNTWLFRGERACGCVYL